MDSEHSFYRRDLFKLTTSFLKPLAFSPFLPESPDTIKFEGKRLMFETIQIGPIRESSVSVLGNGTRAIWFDAENIEHLIAGTENDGTFETQDMGRTWKKLVIPFNKERPVQTLRDIVSLDEKDQSILLVFDKHLVLGFKRNNSFLFEDVTPNLTDNTYQTACFDPKNKNIIVGCQNIAGGLLSSKYSEIKSSFLSNLKSGEKRATYNWLNIVKINTPGSTLTRSITKDKDKIYVGGWGNADNRVSRAGVSICLDANTLEQTTNPYNLTDSLGDLPVNSQKVIDYQDTSGVQHKIFISGAERGNYVLKNNLFTLNERDNFLNIFVDGFRLPDDVTNCNQIYEQNNSPIVTCAHGIEEMRIVGERYVVISLYSKNLLFVPTQELVDVATNFNFSKRLDWISIPKPILGETTMSAAHMRIIPDKNGVNDTILLARINETTKSFPQVLLLKPKLK